MHTTIPEEFFDPEAPMGLGQRHRHPGCCDGKDRALVITRFDRGWLWKCHRCQEKGVKWLEGISPSRYVKWQQSINVKPVVTAKDIELPLDFTYDIPSKGMGWLYSNNLTDSDIKKWQIGYSPTLGRVILPVYQQDELVYWQGRFLGTPDKVKNPKYTNVFKQGRDSIYFWNLEADTKEIVMVEDIISAINVGHICNTVGLLYAYVPDDLVMKLSVRYSPVIMWLDWDKNNRVLGRLKRYRSMGINVKAIMTRLDPKTYDDDYIHDQIYGGN